MEEGSKKTNRISKANANVKIIIIIVTVIAAAAATSTSIYYYGYFLPVTNEPQQDSAEQTDVGSNPNAVRRQPPPMPLIDSHGPAVSSDEAKTLTRFESSSLPSQMPDGLQLDAVRVRTSHDLQENLMTAFYTPVGVKAGDRDTFESVMEGGGIAIIWSHEPTSSSYDQASWIEAFVTDAPDVRRTETINDYPAIAVTGNPDKGLTYQVFLYKGDMQINLVSLKFTDTELLKIASSIP